jgi:hypothetical protein
LRLRSASEKQIGALPDARGGEGMVTRKTVGALIGGLGLVPSSALLGGA